MSLREKINENPQIAAGVGGAVALIAVLYILWSLFSGGGGVPSFDPNDAQLYYTKDEGATFQPGPVADRMKPGIVQAHVYTLPDGKTQIVGYLERWSAEGIAANKDLEKAIKSNNKAETQRLDAAAAAGHEVRKPKVGTWVTVDKPEAAKIMTPTGPKGEEDLTEVYPPPKS